MFGFIQDYDPERRFGHIVGKDGQEIFFHRKESKPAGNHSCLLLPGTEVQFDYNVHRERAVNVTLVDPPQFEPEDSTVTFIVPGREAGWAVRLCGCFIHWNRGQITTLGEETLHIGSWIRHTIAQTKSGLWHAANIEIYQDNADAN